MAKVKLSTTLPRDETKKNGLDQLHHRLVTTDQSRYVVGVVIPHQTVTNRYTKTQVVEVVWVAIEGLTDPADVADAQRLVERAQRRRLGHNPDQIDLSPEMVIEPATQHAS